MDDVIRLTPDSRLSNWRGDMGARRLVDECKAELARYKGDYHDDFPAAICALLSHILLHCSAGSMQERIEELIGACATIDFQSQTVAPSAFRGIAEVLLGTAYFHRQSGDLCRNRRVARDILERSLKHLPADTDATIIAHTHHLLGALYTQSPKANPNAARLAVYHCFRASRLVMRETNRVRWAVIMSDLGLAHLANDDQEAAIASLQLALDSLSISQDPRLWAFAQARIGLAFATRTIGDASRNQELALSSYMRGMRALVGPLCRRERLGLQLNLAICLGRRKAGSRHENLSIAIALLEGLVVCFDRVEDKAARNRAVRNLARFYFRRSSAGRMGDLTRAISYYRAALDSWDPEDGKLSRGIAIGELSRAERMLGELARSPTSQQALDDD